MNSRAFKRSHARNESVTYCSTVRQQWHYLPYDYRERRTRAMASVTTAWLLMAKVPKCCSQMLRTSAVSPPRSWVWFWYDFSLMMVLERFRFAPRTWWLQTNAINPSVSVDWIVHMMQLSWKGHLFRNCALPSNLPVPPSCPSDLRCKYHVLIFEANLNISI